jgi:hypothetical protein
MHFFNVLEKNAAAPPPPSRQQQRRHEHLWPIGERIIQYNPYFHLAELFGPASFTVVGFFQLQRCIKG